MRQQHGRVIRRDEPRFAAGAAEDTQAHIDIADVVAVAQRHVDVVLISRRFVDGTIAVDRQRRSQPAVDTRVVTLPEIRHDVGTQQSPILLPGEIHHRLAELVLAVDVAGGIRLVDDVHQVRGLGDAPEHRVDAREQLDRVALPRPVGLLQIDQVAFLVHRVPAQERNDRGTLVAFRIAPAQLGRRSKR